MASIEELKGVITGGRGLALPTQYMVEMPLIEGSNLSAAERNVLCRTTRLPGRQILTTDRNIGLMNQKIGVGYAVDDITMSFHVLNDYKTRDYFDRWQNLIVDQNTHQIRYADQYKKNIKIYQLQKGKAFDLGNLEFGIFGININLDFDVRTSSKIIYGVELEGAFPITVNGIDLADASTGQTVEVSVNLSYKNWKRIR
jgi:hypothetical protein